jgi:hypothetical protein
MQLRSLGYNLLIPTPSLAFEDKNNDGEVITSASAKPYEAGNLKNFINWAFSYFREGEKQQHFGENWYLFGDGSPTGFDINAPHANPDGENRSIDISGMFPSTNSADELDFIITNVISGLDGFNSVVNDLYDRLNFPNYIEMKRCTVCGDTLELDAPKSYHTAFDTIKVHR